MDKLKLTVRATDGKGRALRFRVHAIDLTVSQSFGRYAQYKGRNEEAVLEIEPENLAFDIEAPDDEGFDNVPAADVLAAILGPVVRGCEIVVAGALEREEEVKEETLKKAGKKVAKMN